MNTAESLDQNGWLRFEATDQSLRWAEAANSRASDVLADPDLRRTWLQCQGTWFVGVDALPTDAAGSISGRPLGETALDVLHPFPNLHPAQLSVIYPGYPKPRAGESEANFRFRKNRFAAHVDGILAEGPKRRRFVREPHALIVGIALNDAPMDAGPLVVWDKSHIIMGAAFREALAGVALDDMADQDVTDAYAAARKQVFEDCQIVHLPLKRGEAVLLHRMALHGIAPWRSRGESFPQGRRIAYFRPQLEGGVARWISTQSAKQSPSAL